MAWGRAELLTPLGPLPLPSSLLGKSLLSFSPCKYLSWGAFPLSKAEHGCADRGFICSRGLCAHTHPTPIYSLTHSVPHRIPVSIPGTIIGLGNTAVHKVSLFLQLWELPDGKGETVSKWQVSPLGCCATKAFPHTLALAVAWPALGLHGELCVEMSVSVCNTWERVHTPGSLLLQAVEGT